MTTNAIETQNVIGLTGKILTMILFHNALNQKVIINISVNDIITAVPKS